MGAMTDSVTVQGYLQSREAMMRLNESLGFKAYFSQPAIDPLRRLANDATNEDAYDLYAKTVLIGYDPTEGVIKMEVKAIDPQTAVDFSRALISYAEEQVFPRHSGSPASQRSHQCQRFQSVHPIQIQASFDSQYDRLDE